LTKDKITGGKIIWLIIRFLVQILAGISHNNVSMVVGLGLVVRENVGAKPAGVHLVCAWWHATPQGSPM
jgi:hypothetical protein